MGAVHRVKIGSTDVTRYVLFYEVDDSTETVIDRARISFSAELQQNVTLGSGLTLSIERGSSTSDLRFIHQGYIEAWVFNEGNIDIDSPNKLWKLAQTEVTATFDKNNSTEAGVISEIIKTLINTYGGLTANSTSVPDSTATQGQLLRKFICKNDNLLERIETLAKVLNWQVRYDPNDDLVYVEPEGTTSYASTLYCGVTGQTSYWLRIPTVEYDYERIINQVKIIGAVQREEGIVENFTGDGSTTEFELTYPPEDTKVTVAGVTQTRGAYDQSSGSYNYVVDQPDKLVVFSSAPAGAAAIVVTYTANRPIPVIMKDNYSITNYTNNEIRMKSFTFNDIISVTDAELRGAKILSEFSSPTVKYQGPLNPAAPIILAGMSVPVRDDISGVNQDLVVRSITRKYPAFEDFITLSDRRLIRKDTMEAVLFRIDRLEREASRNDELVRHRFDSDHESTSQRRCTHFYKKSIGTTAQYNNVAAVYGSVVYGANGNPENLVQVWQGDNTFREHLYDTLFWDTANSTCTFDTTNRRIIQ